MIFFRSVKSKASVLSMLIFVVLITALDGQTQGQKVTRQSAINAFAGKQYDLAYRQFSELLSNFPGDPVYKYYCGACLVETSRDPMKASSLLNEAAHESGVMRTVPKECYFYLGRALQMSGRFQDAITSFNTFTGLAGKKSARELNVPEFIRQCSDQQGKLTTEAVPRTATGKQDTISEVNPAKVSKADSSGTEIVRKQEVDSLPPDYDKLLLQALDARIQADSAALKKGQANSIAAYENNSIGIMINAAAVKKDTVVAAKTKPQAGVPVYNEFSVTDKPVYDKGERIMVDPDVPNGLIYRIQIAVFRNPIAPQYFKGIRPVEGFKNKSTGITTYYAGKFRKSADAGQALLKVKSKGFKDAFVVALMDRKVVSNERSLQLEKEWGSKPLYTLAPAGDEAVRDTVPPTLVLRVEVKRTNKPLPENQVESLRKLAGSRGLEIINPEPKKYIYLIGKFLSFPSAAEYADLLIRNGYSDAKVSAWLGKREIPVETAKQLFGDQQPDN